MSRENYQENVLEIPVGWGVEEIEKKEEAIIQKQEEILENSLREIEAIEVKLKNPQVPQGKKEKLQYRYSQLKKKIKGFLV